MSLLHPIPAYHIAILALLYAAEYFWRAWKLADRRYMYIGKAIGRLMLAGVYSIFTFVEIDAEVRSMWLRWALLMFLVIDLTFVAYDHISRAINARTS